MRYGDAARNGAKRAAQLTQRLLAFSRQQPLKPLALDTNKLVGRMATRPMPMRTSRPRKGYFRWQCQPQGCDTDAVSASDGEAATALPMAAGAARRP